MEKQTYKWKVVRYFDTYPDGVVSSHTTKEDAQEACSKQKARCNRYKVTYEVRENE